MRQGSVYWKKEDGVKKREQESTIAEKENGCQIRMTKPNRIVDTNALWTRFESENSAKEYPKKQIHDRKKIDLQGM